MKFETLQSFAIAVWMMWTLIILSAIGGLLYVAWHFINRYW